MDYQTPAGFDRMIHQPSRLAIMAILAGCERADFTYLQEASGLTKGTLSKHLTKLEEAGYINIKKSFRNKYPLTQAALTRQGRKAFKEYRQSAATFLAALDPRD